MSDVRAQDMTLGGHRGPIERSAVVAGLVSFLVFVIAVPLAIVLAASFGPSQWVADYLAPVKPYESLLFIPVGAVTAWRSQSAPMTNTIFVGLVGGVSVLLLALAIQASPHLGFASALFNYVLLSVGSSGLGAALILPLLRNRHAL
jgi:hypothetical protein